MTLKAVALLVVVGAVPGTTQLYAHHSAAAQFDTTKRVTIQGTITKVEMTNPHGWIYVNVKGPDGRAKNFACQTSAPVALIRRGGDKKTLAIGTTITVDGWLAKDGSNSLNARTITTADGKNITGDTAQ